MEIKTTREERGGKVNVNGKPSVCRPTQKRGGLGFPEDLN